MLRDEFWEIALLAATAVVIGRLSWRVLRKQGIGGVPFVLVAALILIYFLQPWLDATYQQAGLAGKIALVFFTGMLAILALLPKGVRDTVIGNFVYEALRGLFRFLGVSVRGLLSSWNGRGPWA